MESWSMYSFVSDFYLTCGFKKYNPKNLIPLGMMLSTS